jgi:REP element-mobilizing transposase RayT
MRDVVIVPQLRTVPRHPHVDYASQRVFFVTFCVWDRRKVFNESAAAASMRDILFHYRERQWYWILCYCVMSDHIHMLLKLRSSDHKLSRIIATLKHESAKRLKRVDEAFRWQYGYYDRVLRSNDSEFAFAHYIMQNPVRAGIVKEAEDYPWSGIVDRFW